MAHSLYGQVMNYSPCNPHWANRDRFILSNGHGCALQYAMLHLAGFDLSIDELKNFRQPGSKTPGHPECFVTPGIEVCTGPLGQGIANAVGTAIAAEHYSAKYNKPDMTLFDNHVYSICGDGCLQEGVSGEAASLAGTLKLGRLTILYDSNNITIDGHTELSFTEDVRKRYEAYHWHVSEVSDGDSSATLITDAIKAAHTAAPHQPKLIIVKTTIGKGSLKQGTEGVHGAPLKLDDMKQLKEKCGFNPDASFEVVEETKDFYAEKQQKCSQTYNEWVALFKNYKAKYPTEAEELERRFAGELPADWESCIPKFEGEVKANGTRAYAREALNGLFNKMPELLGGSADLKESNRTDVDGEGSGDFAHGTYENRYIRFGVREHAMFAIANGMFAYGGIRPFVATFMNFLTYGWGAARLSALSNFGIGYIMTHDSIELGEDGPTHQPIEVLPLVRATPNMLDIRPADALECSGAYKVWAANGTRPSVICLSRSATPAKLPGSSIDGVSKGAYVLIDFANNGKPKVIIAASGSEVSLAVDAHKRETELDIRVVSFPSWTLFEEQSAEYKQSVFGKKGEYKALYVEASSTFGHEKYFDDMIGMTTFGMSAAKKFVWRHFGFTVSNIVNKARTLAGLPCVAPVAGEEYFGVAHPCRPHPQIPRSAFAVDCDSSPCSKRARMDVE
eukprot:GDKK01059829.1.p1 GENE.GDKK01059829.1~~GDKK01059829.1.p1  ORF type:complete len:722 (-),score=230.88 GDKK01059829.1:553-2583(-)